MKLSIKLMVNNFVNFILIGIMPLTIGKLPIILNIWKNIHITRNGEYMENEILIDEVGYLAKLIDEEMTIFERMKIKKSTLKRMAGAMVVYISVIITFSVIL